MIATAWPDRVCCRCGAATLLQCSALLLRVAIPMAPDVSRRRAFLPGVRPPATPASDVTIRRYEIQKPHANHGAHHSVHHVLVTGGQYHHTRTRETQKAPSSPGSLPLLAPWSA